MLSLVFLMLLPSPARATPGALLQFAGRDCRVLMSKSWPEARPGYLVATDVAADLSASADFGMWLSTGAVGNLSWRTFQRAPDAKQASDVGALILTDQALLVPQLSSDGQAIFMSRNSPENPNRSKSVRSSLWIRVTVTRTTPLPENGNVDAFVEVRSTHAHPGTGGVYVPDGTKTFSFGCLLKK